MHRIVCDVSTGEVTQVDLTAEEKAEYDTKKATWDAGANDRKAAEVRTERNTKLVATDWTQIADVPQAIKDKIGRASCRERVSSPV